MSGWNLKQVEMFMKKISVIVGLCLFIGNLLVAETNDPVAVLFQVKGHVEYTKNGTKWIKVRQNKFLFAGYQIRTNSNGSGIIKTRKTGKDSVLHPGTKLIVTDSGIRATKGVLTDSGQPNKLLSGLLKRFSKSQSHTTVRRSSQTEQIEPQFSRHTILTEEYPFLVWENIDHAATYRLKIGLDTYNVIPSGEDIIRTKIKPFCGTREIELEAFKGGKSIGQLQPFNQRGELKKQTVHWLSPEENSEFKATLQSIADAYPHNSFMLGSFLEKEQMWVAAMDQYQQYLKNNPEEIEITPYLFRVYKKLKLKKIYGRELSYWTQAMNE
jgi:magnetotaxis MtxA-like protein